MQCAASLPNILTPSVRSVLLSVSSARDFGFAFLSRLILNAGSAPQSGLRDMLARSLPASDPDRHATMRRETRNRLLLLGRACLLSPRQSQSHIARNRNADARLSPWCKRHVLQRTSRPE